MPTKVIIGEPLLFGGDCTEGLPLICTSGVDIGLRFSVSSSNYSYTGVDPVYCKLHRFHLDLVKQTGVIMSPLNILLIATGVQPGHILTGGLSL